MHDPDPQLTQRIPSSADPAGVCGLAVEQLSLSSVSVILCVSFCVLVFARTDRAGLG